MRKLPSNDKKIHQDHAGFTLIETIIVVFIIGLLAGLLLVAVQSSRAAARRIECVNHLKQIGIALQSYESTNQRFPTTAGCRHEPNNGACANMISPLVCLLPQLDLPNLYNSTNFTPDPTFPQGLQDNLTVMRTTVSIFLCPADPSNSPEGYGRNNYRFNMGPGPWSACFPTTIPGCDCGPFTIDQYHSTADFPDGLSTTVGVSERIRGNWTKGVWFPGNYLALHKFYQKITISSAVSMCESATLNEKIETRSGESWFITGFHFTEYNHCATPNSKIYDCSEFSTTENIHWRTLHVGVFTARSYHSGGVDAMMMDGSVRFIGDGIHLSVWRALSTRNGGEVIDGDF